MMNMLERMGMVSKVSEPVAEQEPAPAQEEAAVQTAPEPAPAPVPVPMPMPMREYTPAPPPEPRPEPEFSRPTVMETVPQRTYGDFEPSAASTGSFWDQAPQITPDTDRFLEVEELYRSFGLPTSGTSTIYLVEEYLKTLPDSLPAESRRSIILRLISASGFDFDRLLDDGLDRVSKLNEYAAGFSAHTDEITAKNNAEIDALERQIARIRDVINDRKNLHKRQFLAIEGEAQRLKQVLDFITK